MHFDVSTLPLAATPPVFRRTPEARPKRGADPKPSLPEEAVKNFSAETDQRQGGAPAGPEGSWGGSPAGRPDIPGRRA